MDWVALGIFIAVILFTAGGLVWMLQSLKRKVDSHSVRITANEMNIVLCDKHMLRHDGYFEKLQVQYDFIVSKLNDQSDWMLRNDKKLDNKKDK